ncbi:unnamed protein product [Trichogramma brassicae]|uniref:CCHC-type domain-containing protein n=1 Tax=Trichogramma brassicae TaxID=86971 RepID=A0A6H5J4Y0_9HYME|nr:unnamed protein product [Trichogramma brassicae]
MSKRPADASPEMRVPPKRSAGFSGPIQTDQNNNVAEDCDDYVLVGQTTSPAAQAAAPDADQCQCPTAHVHDRDQGPGRECHQGGDHHCTDALLGVPVSRRDPVKSLRKAYAGTQVAVVALPDDLAATALKLGHVRISWVNCRIRAREEAARCYRCWSPGHVAARCKGPRPHGALLTDAARRATKQRTAKANHRAFSAENEELTTIVTRPQPRAALWPEDHPGPPMMRILQLNLNHCEAAQDPALRHYQQAAHRRGHLVCEQYKNLAPPNTWLADADGQAAIWVHGGIPVQERPARVHPYFAWARIGKIFFFSVYAPPRLSEREFSTLLANITEEAPRQKAPCYCGGLQRMVERVDGVGM